MPVATGLVQSNQNKSLIKNYLNTFISDDFLSSIINICLYPSEFNVVVQDNSNSILKLIFEFLKDLSKSCDNINVANIKNVKSNINLVSRIITIRDTHQSLLSYDNIYNHFQNIELIHKKLIQNAITNKITDSNKFKKTIDEILGIIHAYDGLCVVSKSLIEFDNVNDALTTRPDISPIESLKLISDAYINGYNDISKIKVLEKFNNESDYYVISNEKSIDTLANTLVEFISEGYNYYETGYKIFDTHIGGLESSTLHLVSAAFVKLA